MAQGLDAVTHRRAPEGSRLSDAGVFEQCADADIFCMQEIFSAEAQALFDRLGSKAFAASFRDHNRPTLWPTTARGTGLGISTRAALGAPQLRPFQSRGVGWDKLARKGALFARITLAGGAEVDVLTSHLQANYDEAAAQVRAAQLVELRRLIDELGSPDRPFLVCGDFNIDGLATARGQVEFQRLAAALEGFEDLGAGHDLPTFDIEGNALALHYEPRGWVQRIDYIFYRAPARGPGLRCRQLARFLDQPRRDSPPHLPASWPSDHYGLRAVFDYG